MSTLVANATRPNRVCDREMPPDDEQRAIPNPSSTLAFSVVSSSVSMHSNPVVHFERANTLDFKTAPADTTVCALQNFNSPSPSNATFDATLSNKENPLVANKEPPVIPAAMAANKHNKKRRLLKGCRRQLKRILKAPGLTSATHMKQSHLHKCKSESEYQVYQHCCPSTEALQDLQTKYAELSTEVCSLRRRLTAVQDAFTSLRTMLLASFPTHSEITAMPSVNSNQLETEHVPCQISEHLDQSQKRSYGNCFQTDCSHIEHVNSNASLLAPTVISLPSAELQSGTVHSPVSSTDSLKDPTSPTATSSASTQALSINLPSTTESLCTLSVQCSSQDERLQSQGLLSTDQAEPAISTAQLASLVLARMRQLNMSNRSLCRALNVSQYKKIGDLLRNPKPWCNLSRSSWLTYGCMYRWLLNSPLDGAVSGSDPLESPSLSLPPLSVQSTDTSCTLSAVEEVTPGNLASSEIGIKTCASFSDSHASPMSVGSTRSVETTGTAELYSSSISQLMPQTSRGNVLPPANSVRRWPNTVNNAETDVETQRRICDILSAAREAMAQANTESCSQLGNFAPNCSRRRKRSCDFEAPKRIKCEPKTSDAQDPVPDAAASTSNTQPFNYVSCGTDVKAIVIAPQSVCNLKASTQFPSTSPACVSVESNEPPSGVLPNVTAHGLTNSTVQPSIPGSVGFTIPQTVYQNPQLSDLLHLISMPSASTTHLPCTVGSQTSYDAITTCSSLQARNLQSVSVPSFSGASDHAEFITRATVAPTYVSTVPVQEPFVSRGVASHSQLDSTGTISVQPLVGLMPVSRNVIFLAAAPTTAMSQPPSNLTKPVSSVLFAPTTTLPLSDSEPARHLDAPVLYPAIQTTAHQASLHASADSVHIPLEDSLPDPHKDNTTETIGGLELTSDQLLQLTDRIPPLDVFELAAKAKNFLREFNVSQRHFGEAVLNMSQASVSDILNKPRPWTSLPSRWRLAYLRLHIWLQQRFSGSEPIQWAQRFERLRNKCAPDAADVAHIQTNDLEQTGPPIDSPQPDTEVICSRKREHSGLTANPTFGTPSKWARSDVAMSRSPQPSQQSSSAGCTDFERQSLFDIAKAAAAAMQRANSSCSFKAGKLRALADSPTVSTASSKSNTPMKNDSAQLDTTKSPTGLLSPGKYSFGRNRIVFTPHQKEMLVASFNRQPYPHSDRLRELASELDLSYKTVLNWFHNRRMRSRQPRPTADRNPSSSLPTAKPDSSNLVTVCESPVRNCSQVFDAALSTSHSDPATRNDHPEPAGTQMYDHQPSTQPGHANRRKRPDPSRLIAPCL